jgi:hypothetical protein
VIIVSQRFRSLAKFCSFSLPYKWCTSSARWFMQCNLQFQSAWSSSKSVVFLSGPYIWTVHTRFGRMWGEPNNRSCNSEARRCSRTEGSRELHTGGNEVSASLPRFQAGTAGKKLDDADMGLGYMRVICMVSSWYGATSFKTQHRKYRNYTRSCKWAACHDSAWLICSPK